jgi:hypothetical protein
LLEDAMNDLDRELKTARRSSESAIRRAGGAPWVVVSVLAMAVAGCTETYDAGSNSPHGLLPVDERNPIVLLNDSESDNWQGEYAVLLANGGGPRLVGIIVGTNPNSPILEDNVAEWRKLVKAARASRLQNIPDPIGSNGDPLTRPSSGEIDETVANHSEGANAILAAANDFTLPYRPLVVLTGGRLTDVADAYRMDPSVTERVVVVSALGGLTSTGGAMGIPNGEMDPWADTIVTARFRYVQVSAFYDQLTDVPASRLLSDLPDNAFGQWIAAKQPKIWNDPQAADQVAVAAIGIPSFVLEVERVSPVGPTEAGATVGPALKASPDASGWLVRRIDSAAATERFWNLLHDPETFPPVP